MDYETGEYRRPIKADEKKKKPLPDKKVKKERKYDDLLLFLNVPF